MIKLTWKIWLLIIILLFSFLSIFGFPPQFLEQGVLISSVEKNSTAFEQGLRKGQIIVSIDNKKIQSIEDYSKIVNEKFPSSEKIKISISTKDSEHILFTDKFSGIIVSEIPKTKIKTGLDLSGGTRALVKAKDKSLSTSELNDLIDIVNNRLNV